MQKKTYEIRRYKISISYVGNRRKSSTNYLTITNTVTETHNEKEDELGSLMRLQSIVTGNVDKLLDKMLDNVFSHGLLSTFILNYIVHTPLVINRLFDVSDI
ncbi:putative microcin B17-processing protein McbB [Trichinella spiralis]|uniref:putative microcin B17-processing protein McbB n=1 Tax=Trichinella spiralis TaxID=6334 RepID=UPI0001EFB573|nr:putative microcin B17-processing protein McbB [Trichinella spiralis]